MFPFVHVIFSFLLMSDITLFIYIMYTVLSWGGSCRICWAGYTGNACLYPGGPLPGSLPRTTVKDARTLGLSLTPLTWRSLSDD